MGEGSARAIAEHLAVAAQIEQLVPQVDAIAQQMIETYAAGRAVFAFGNGGSAADAQHLAAELIGRYKRERRPLAASALTVDPSVVTAIANDYSFDDLFARQVRALASAGDLVVAFTTSGSAANVVNGLVAARERGATTVLFVGGGTDTPAAAHADHVLAVPSTTTARIQEMHLLLLHLVVDQVDAWAAGETDR
jgi:D-sedoheptulose 7-phosphate isomerase